MSSLALFLGSVVLAAAGVLLMAADSANFGFVIGLFTTMAAIFLWAISLNYGVPPAAHPLDDAEGARAAVAEPLESSSP